MVTLEPLINGTFDIALSPLKKTKKGGDQFEVTLQDGPKSSVYITGFNKETHTQLNRFAQSKSPVKITVQKNPGYKLEVVNERSRIAVATSQEVPYEFAPEICKTDEKKLPPSNRYH